MRLQALGQGVAGLDAFARHHVRHHDLAPSFVRCADHRALGHVRMREQRCLDLGSGDVVAGRHDEVVEARGEVEPPPLVAPEGVARQVPAGPDILRLLFAAEIAATGRAADRKATDRAVRQLVAVLADNARLVSGHRNAGRARFRLAGAVRDEDVEELGGADAVQDGLPRARGPRIEDRCRQCLSGGYREAQRREVRPLVHRVQHRAVGGGRGEHDARPVPLDEVHHVLRGRLLEQGGGRAEAKREDREAAQPEGECEGRRPDEDIVGGYPEHFPGIAVRGREQVAVKVHRRLGLASGAGGEGEQGDVVAAGRHRVEPDRLGQGDPVELRVVVGGAVEADDLLQKAARLGAGDQLVHHPGVAEGEPDAGLLDDPRELSGAQHRHGVHHHRPRLGGREPASDHRRVVGGADQHPVPGLHAEVVPKGPGQAVGPVGQLLVGAAPAMPDEGHVIAEARLHHPIGEFDGGVQPLGVVGRAGEEVRPLLGRRQVVAGEGVHVGRRPEGRRHVLLPPLSRMVGGPARSPGARAARSSGARAARVPSGRPRLVEPGATLTERFSGRCRSA